ncbi:SLOG family protein [Streptomyces sp. NPDC051994]|uniref:SLOG family protein n=1 Tax=unclassified Streptomyces TaxID=2593676 RepID=UPI00343896B2
MTGRAPYRVLVTGSRDWRDEQLVRRELARAWRQSDRAIVVVHGACPTGADRHAARWVADCIANRLTGVTEEPHPADWDKHGKAAGPIRNRRMVRARIDLVLAFIHNESAGASHTAALAEAADIETRRWTS